MLWRMVRPSALVFDLDNTLVAEMPTYEAAFGSAIAPFAEREGVSVGALRGAVFDASAELWLGSPVADYCLRLGLGSPTSLLSDFPGKGDELARLRAWVPGYRRMAWMRGLATVGVPQPERLAGELARAFRASFPQHCVAYPDVVPALAELSREYDLAIVTNGPSDVQTTKIRAAGLERFFSVVVASSDVGCGKPDAAIFSAAVTRLGLTPNEVVAVGDSVDRDVAGARAAHLRCMWLDRSGLASHYAPDMRITSLAELPGLLSAGLYE